MKKFYQTVATVAEEGGFAVTLDGRAIKTPGKSPLLVPTQAMASAVADEWRAQEEDIDPATMPMTQLVNTAIDRVGPRVDAVVEELVAFAHTDLICYRTTDQDDLAAKQLEAWQPYLDWLHSMFGIELKVTSGIMPIAQDDSVIETLRSELQQLDVFSLTAFHAFVGGFGSIAIAFALVKGFGDFESCWQAAHVDEIHQESLWGLDIEVEEKRNRLKKELETSLVSWGIIQA